MNRTIDFTQPGGLFVYQDTLDFLQTAYAGVLDAIAAMYGDKVIIQGLTGTSPLSDGWVAYNGELIPVVGAAPLAYLHLNTTLSQEQYADGTARNAYTVKNFSFSSSASGNVAFNTFKRLPYNTSTIYDALNQVKTLLKLVINVESAVILSGCAITNIVGSTCDISAGTVLMDGEVVSAPAVLGQSFPFWLKTDGTYVTADPGGTNVKFDYETSQRYAHVMKRFQYGSGEVVMSKSAADVALFDAASGLGKWKWLGWKICNVMRSRVPVGYDNRTSNPGGGDLNAWDSDYNTIVNTGGENEKEIARANLPNEELKINIWTNSQDYDDGTADQNNIGTDPTPSNPVGTSAQINTEALGDGDAFDVRQSYTVILFIERI